ncbi:MAG: hypothetical protein IBX61_02330 [Thermoleophilia bacterium]|nr:hypothetical protein [Thermoleophilia bacterium]
MISRFEKVVLVILAGLGAGYWGYGLLLVIMFPGEFRDYFHKWNVLILLIERGIGFGLFLIYGLAIQKKWVKKRYLAWGLFVFTLLFAILLIIILDTIFDVV